MIWSSGGSKSRLAKATGAEESGQIRDEKLHAIARRSTFPNHNLQNIPCSDHFWKLRCRKSGRRYGTKHMSKSTCTKHTILGPLFEIEMSKKCTPFWREAHFEVKIYKTHQHRCPLRKIRKSRKITLFLTLSSAKIEEVSQNCFVFDVVKLKTCGSLAELLRFWCCQLWKTKKSRRIALFSSLQIDR